MNPLLKLVLNQSLDMDWILKDANPRGIIEAGAYTGDFWTKYDSFGVKNRCWIEACSETFRRLVTNVPIKDVCLNYAVCDVDGDLSFTVTNNFQSSSLLPLKRHSELLPHIVPIREEVVVGRRMDTLVDAGLIDMDKYDFLLMDLQGGEYKALQGFSKNIHRINYIVAEINYEEMYEGCMLVDDFDQYLFNLGFDKILVTQHMAEGWGDGYYKRRRNE